MTNEAEKKNSRRITVTILGLLKNLENVLYFSKQKRQLNK